MARFKPRRNKRYLELIQSYITDEEARPLSRVPTKLCPYMKEVKRDRLRMRVKAKTLGLTEKQWREQIAALYRRKGWVKRDALGRLKIDPWKMIRSYEEKYRARYPQYESPWEPRYRKWRDFLRYMDETVDVQGGRSRYWESP